jgi:hypothetical protein
MSTGIEKFRDLRDRLSRDPCNGALLYSTCAAGEHIAFDETLALLADRVKVPSVDPAIRLKDLHLYAVLRERQGRRAANLSTTNARNPADLTFAFARQELATLVWEASEFLARHPESSDGAILLAEAYACAGWLDKAEVVFAQLRAVPDDDHVAAVVNFDPGFHASLGEEAALSLSRLPSRVSMRAVPPSATRIVVTCADYLYFQKFGWTFVETFARYAGAGTLLCLHIFDMTPDESRDLVRRLESYGGLQWALSTEWTGLRGGPHAKAAGYYHAVRFIRFWQVLAAHPAATGWLIDTDTIFNGDTARLFDEITGHDTALFLAPGRFEVRNKVVASCTGVSNTAAARHYLRDVAGYVAAFWKMGRLPWGLDQVAMYAVLATPAVDPPRVASLPPHIVGGRDDSGSLLRSAKDHAST